MACHGEVSRDYVASGARFLAAIVIYQTEGNQLSHLGLGFGCEVPNCHIQRLYGIGNLQQSIRTARACGAIGARDNKEFFHYLL